MSLAKIRLEGSGPTGRDYRVFLNGEDISRYVRGAKLIINIGADDLNTVSLDFPATIEIPDEIMTRVSAGLDAGGVD